MKQLTLNIVIFLISTSALGAEVEWAKTAFWKSPYPKTVSMQITQAPAYFIKECQELNDSLFDQNGKSKVWNKRQLEVLRTLPTRNVMDESFVVDLKTNIKADGSMMNESVSQMMADVVKPLIQQDTLPGYTQKTADLVLDVQNLQVQSHQAQEGSITNVSQSFGLEPKPVQFIAKEGSIFLRSWGKDTACDLIHKKLSLQAKGNVEVKIWFEEQVRLEALYSSIQKAQNEMEGKFRTARAKAAAMGIRIGNSILNSAYKNDGKTETYISGLMEYLFKDDSMALGSVWSQAPYKSQLSVDGTSPSMPVTIVIQ